MARTKAPKADLEQLIRAGLRNCQIEDHFGMRHGALAYRLRRLRAEIRRRDLEARLRQGVQVYTMPPEEVERRYGRPGENAVGKKQEIDWYKIKRAEEGGVHGYET